MGWKDLMKNVTDKATSVAETAQAKFEEQKQLSAIKKEEQNKKMEEMNERVTEYEQELLQNILSGFSGAPCIEVEDNILDFTKDYFEKLLLPANSVSASKITMYPYSDKIQKKAQKALREYDDTETPVFQFEGNKGEFILMTPTKLYIAVAFPENQTFVANVAVDLQQVSQLGFVSTEEGYQVVCNGVELFSADNVSEFDRITIEEYVRRLEEKDFEITETQIDEVIKKKIGDNILRIIRQYVFDDELLIYFAWGMDNITAKDFVVCTNKQILMLDREMLGATKNVKQFYYEDITSMSTDQKTSGWLEFALTAAFKLCNITIYVSGAQEKIQTLFIAGCIAKRECGLIIIIMNQICQPVLHLLQMLGISIGLDDNEFVSTVSGKETVRIQYPCQAVGKCLDEFITFFVSVCVVDVFQIVQVEHHNTDSKGAWKFSEFSDFIFKRCFIMNSCNIPEGIDQ